MLLGYNNKKHKAGLRGYEGKSKNNRCRAKGGGFGDHRFANTKW
ncbi:hypothetical protein NB11A_17090 [Ligilactobacillus agilis]|uniref:Uncharacterized protein n=1 Tax=Ligilactobacillus agilis TaxID=1601 RepID=A0A6F9Y5W3_9LACO|nr:hypothetical protein SN10121_05360 [Ligilactobacillus agilis]GET12961.1 hypothetical protein SN811_14610 [Ligilactobacillus agilis]GET17418.1 hypothetical protein NB11A_17090 [Ligilactobacillus agilis]